MLGYSALDVAARAWRRTAQYSTSGRGNVPQSMRVSKQCQADSPHLPNLACSAQVKSKSGGMSVQFGARSAGRDRGSTGWTGHGVGVLKGPGVLG